MSIPHSFLGELAALSAAFIWAIASVIYRGVGHHVSALPLNVVKCGIAVGYLWLTILLRGQDWPQFNGVAIGLLMLSGVIGIGIGDTAYFVSLNCLGARRSLLLEAIAPPLAALLAWIILAETLSMAAWLGILLTVAGVVWVVVERVPDLPQPQLDLKRGVTFGLFAATCQATGAMLSRSALTQWDIDPLWSTIFRLMAGVAVLIPWAVYKPENRCEFKPLQSSHLLLIVAGTAFASTYLAIWLQQTALKYTVTGIAQALSATSPLFVLPFAAWAGERVSRRAVLGVIVALGGIWLLFLYRH